MNYPVKPLVEFFGKPASHELALYFMSLKKVHRLGILAVTCFKETFLE